MRTRSTLFAALLFGSLQAQDINTVTLSPQNPTECNLVDIVINVTLPTSGELQGYTISLDGNNITVTLSGSGGTGGSASQTQSLDALGPFAVGSYTLTIPFVYNGVVVDTWTGTFEVLPGFNPDAGEYGELAICNSEANFPLFSILTGTPDPGGIWYNPNNQVVPNGQFDPGQSLEGFYTYSFNVQAPCVDDEAQVLIFYLPNNNSGLNAVEQVCTVGDTLVDLFAQLGGAPTTGGVWTFGGSPVGSTMQPGVDPCGVYTYTVEGIAPCGSVSSTVNVQCIQAPNAGTNIGWEVCWDDSTENLNTALQGEQPGGTWFDPVGFSLGGFNANINCPLIGSGDYLYVVDNAACLPDTAYVTVTINGTGPLDDCTIGVAELNGSLNRFELAPNPAMDQVTIDVEMNRANGEHSLELVNANGAVVRSERLTFNGLALRHTMDLSGLAKGVYLVRLSSPEGQALRRLAVQ